MYIALSDSSAAPQKHQQCAAFGESQHDVCAKLIHGLASHGAVFQGFAVLTYYMLKALGFSGCYQYNACTRSHWIDV